MIPKTRRTAATAVIGAAMIAVSLIGCSRHSSNAAPTTSAPQQADYTALLIHGSDIALPGDEFTDGPRARNPNGAPGVDAVFGSRLARSIVERILVLPDAAGATGALAYARASLNTKIGYNNAPPQPVALGDNGIVAAGTRAPTDLTRVALPVTVLMLPRAQRSSNSNSTTTATTRSRRTSSPMSAKSKTPQ